MSALAEILLLALLGGVHCAGMCGAISVAVATGPAHGGRFPFALRMGSYLAGKALSYAFLGAVVAAAGAAWLESAHLHAWRRFAEGSAALVIALAGLRLAGWLPLLPAASAPDRWVAALTALLRRAFAAWSRLPGLLGPAALGVLNGFLPCGLVLAALLVAVAAGGAVRAALLMLAFGAATAPALLLPAWAGRRASLARRPGLRRGAGFLLIALALLPAARAAFPGSAPLPACCRKAPSAAPPGSGHAFRPGGAAPSIPGPPPDLPGDRSP